MIESHLLPAPAPVATEIVHSMPGRLRLRVRGLRHDQAGANHLAASLRNCGEIHTAEASPVTGTLLLRFDPLKPTEKMAALVHDVLAGRRVPPASSPDAAKKLTRSSKTPTQKHVASELISERITEPITEPWHAFPAPQVLQMLGVTKSGLSVVEAHLRLQRTGRNVLPTPPKRSLLLLLWDQVSSIPVILLLSSAAFSFLTGAIIDAAVISAVVLINAVIGFATEKRAERTIATLTTLAEPETLVLRGGRILEIDAADLTVGDILPLARGAYIPADARLIESRDLSVAESSLTGESAPVTKTIDAVPEITPLAERRGMVYRGTVVAGGSGIAVVTTTGSGTEIGLVHRLINESSRPQTPMERQLDRLGRQTAYAAIGVCALAMLLGAVRGFHPVESIRAAISLAVAALPEGLPAMATTALAFGMMRMRKQDVLARSLGAVEAAGGMDLLCLDKTGTLTVNRMTAVEVYAAGQRLPAGPPRPFQAATGKEKTPHLDMLLAVCGLCSEAAVSGSAAAAPFAGSATEVALLELVRAASIDIHALRGKFPRVELQDRAEGRNYMVSVHAAPDGRRLVAVKGSPEEVLKLCSRHADASGLHSFHRGDRSRVLAENQRLASQGRRVLAAAYAEVAAGDELPCDDLIWLGLVALADPPRAGAEEAMAALHHAGISTRMVTGDQGATAQAIGREIGLFSRGEEVRIWDANQSSAGLTVDLQNDGGLEESDIFSRVTPSHKLEIVQALQRRGHVVAMTGDGINDGPALKAADIGIALGEGSTETARESADLILRTDDLRGLLVALREGRTVHRNIRQAVRFILATNLSEVLTVLGAVALGLGQPINSRQLLWLNLVTDIFPVLALAVEPPDPGVLDGPPPPANEPIIARAELPLLIAESASIAGSVGVSFAYALRRYGAGAQASTLTFLTLSTAQLMHTLAERPVRHGSAESLLKRNNYVLPAVVGSFALQALTMFTPLRSLLGLTPLTLMDFGVCLGSVALSSLATFLLRYFSRQVYPIAPPRLASTSRLQLPSPEQPGAESGVFSLAPIPA